MAGKGDKSIPYDQKKWDAAWKRIEESKKDKKDGT